MTIKIITDSTSDLPPALAEELGITVVPLYVQFGERSYRDGVDISADEFYRRLLSDPLHPSTSQPTPEDFAKVYRELPKGVDGIVSIHISAKLSGTCNSALQAKKQVTAGCPVEVVDSETTSMGLGQLAIQAATLANSGKNLSEVVEAVRQSMSNTRVWVLFDTLKYLSRGGRIGKAKALFGTLLNIKPVLAVTDGEMAPAGQVRTRAKGMDMLCDFAKTVTDIQDLSVVHSTTPDEANALADSLGATFDRSRIRLARIGPVLGVHTGPGALAVALKGKGKP